MRKSASDITVATSFVSIAFTSMYPMPRCDANISPISVPNRVKEKPMRKPETIYGSAAGTMMFEAVCIPLSRMARAARK